MTDTATPSAPPGQRSRDGLVIWGLCIGIAVIGVIVAAVFIRPAPPRTITLAGGAAGGAYLGYAERYAAYLSLNGIDAKVLTTAGSMENLRLLLDRQADAALLQGGTVPPEHYGELESVVAVFHEPLWLFVRQGVAVKRLDDLRGKRISIGPEGSGTAALAQRLLRETGLDLEALQLTTPEAVASLKAGDLDAVFLVMAPQAPTVVELLADPAIVPATLEHVRAYDRRSDSLTAVTLYAGSVDPGRHLPATDLTLLASAASVVVHKGTHPAVVQLLTQAAVRVHNDGGLLHEPGTFPNTDMVDVPVDDEVAYYLEKGPSWLQRTFPFWLASLIDRAIIMAVPLLALLVPVFRGAPPLYRWRIRSRIYKWYRTLREIDERLRRGASPDVLAAETQRLEHLENELLDVHVPLSYMEEFYHLRLHVDYIRRQLRQHTEAAR